MAADYSLLGNVPRFTPYPGGYGGAVMEGMQATSQMGLQQAQTQSVNFDTKAKQLQMINQLTGSVMNVDTAMKPVAYQQAIQQAQRLGIDISGIPQTWGEEADNFVKITYGQSGQALESLKQQLSIDKLRQSMDAPLSSAGKIAYDAQRGLLSPEQAQQAMAGKGTTVYDPSTGNPIVTMGGGGIQQGMPQAAAVDLLKKENKFIQDSRTEAQTAGENLQNLKQMRDAASQIYTGAGGTAVTAASKIGNLVGLGKNQAALGSFVEQQSNMLRGSLRSTIIGAGQVSNYEQKILEKAIPSIDDTPEGFTKKVDAQSAGLQRKVEFNRFAEQYRQKFGTTEGLIGQWNRFTEENPVLDKNLNVKAENIANWQNYLAKPSTQQPLVKTSQEIPATPEVRVQLRDQYPQLKNSTDQQLDKIIQEQNRRNQRQPATESNLHPETTKVASAIATIESGGTRNPYAARATASRGRYAIGKYQVLNTNVPSWTKEVLGQRMTPDEFKNNPEAQETVARAKISELLHKFGDPQDVAAVWFSGRPAKGNRAYDPFAKINVPQYLQKFNKLYARS